MVYYYVAIDRQQYGPYTLEQLRQQQLPVGALVWREGLPAWLPPNQIPELAAQQSPVAPPIVVAHSPVSIQANLPSASPLNLRLVAEKQRALIYSLIGCGCAYFFGFTCIGMLLDSPPDGAAPPDESAAALALLLRIAIAVGICATQVWACLGIANALKLPQPILWAFGSVFCCIGSIVLLVLNQRATKALTNAGFRVGFLGANLRQFS